MGPPPALQNNTRHPTAAPGAMNPEARTSVGGGQQTDKCRRGGGGVHPHPAALMRKLERCGPVPGFGRPPCEQHCRAGAVRGPPGAGGAGSGVVTVFQPDGTEGGNARGGGGGASPAPRLARTRRPGPGRGGNKMRDAGRSGGSLSHVHSLPTTSEVLQFSQKISPSLRLRPPGPKGLLVVGH